MSTVEGSATGQPDDDEARQAREDAPVGGRLYDELAAGTLPHAPAGQFTTARGVHGDWSPEARAALANELREADAHIPDVPQAARDSIHGVIAALEDRR